MDRRFPLYSRTIKIDINERLLESTRQTLSEARLAVRNDLLFILDSIWIRDTLFMPGAILPPLRFGHRDHLATCFGRSSTNLRSVGWTLGDVTYGSADRGHHNIDCDVSSVSLWRLLELTPERSRSPTLRVRMETHLSLHLLGIEPIRESFRGSLCQERGIDILLFICVIVSSGCLCHVNCQSLLPHFIKFHEHFLRKTFDLIIMSETWLKSHILDGIVDLLNYQLTKLDKTRKGERGINTVRVQWSMWRF